MESKISTSERRPCDACGGTGSKCPSVAMYHQHGTTYFHRYTCDRDPCPVCDGRGWHSDAMPASDALADMLTWTYIVTESYPSTRYFELYGVDGLVVRVREMMASIELLEYSATRWNASMAARAAFRAVPALRESYPINK